MKSLLIIFLCIGFLINCSAEVNGPKINVSGGGIKTDTLEWIFPEEAGWSSSELQEAHQFAIQSGCLAVMALYDGKVFFSRGNIQTNYEVHSIRESLPEKWLLEGFAGHCK